MAANHCDADCLSAWCLEPREVAGRRHCRVAFGAKFHGAVSLAEAHSRRGIDDHAQPLDPSQVFAPAVWPRAIQVFEKLAVPWPVEFGFDLPREGSSLVGVPLRRQPGVHEQVTRIQVNQRQAPQPVEQLATVRSCENLLQGVVFSSLHRA